jgi:ribonuclease R
MAQMKKNKQIESYAQVILQFVGGRSYRPMPQKELIDRLHVVKEHLPLVKQALKQLVDDGQLVFSKGRYYPAEEGAEAFEGIIRVHPRGFGFVEAEGGDLFVPRPAIGGAIDGDTVEAQVTGEGREGKGPEGRVLRIVKRGRTKLAGTVISISRGIQMLAPIMGPDALVDVESDQKLSEGDRILIKVDNWTPPSGRLEKLFGHITDPSIDVEAACEEFEIRTEFRDAALEEAKKIGTEVTAADRKGREDLRKIETVTIDPTTAKDFDDALSLAKDSKGNFHLMVHIADVTHYVQAGSALDKSAIERCNSTYFPGICVPMLPPSLSDNLCSLKPDVDRLAVTVKMQFDKSGKLVKHEIVRSVIRSDRRFSYEEAKQVLDGVLESEHAELLQLMVKLAYLLKSHRRERGSIEFSLPEVVVQIDEGGMPTGTRLVEYDITHQLVEEFMLKANETVATHLTQQGRGLTYRIHDMPTEDDLLAFYQLASAFGFKLPSNPAREDLQQVFDKANKTPYGAQLAVAFIRSMKLAAYSAENIGHYGLSLEHYCHFTSPIRRYADIVVHRVLFDNLFTEEEIAQIAHRCSEQERISSRAESDVLRLKKLRLLDAHKKENPFHQYEAVVASVKPAGITFEVADLMLEGFVHISELGKDYYVFDQRKMSLAGERTGESFRCGDKIIVMLGTVDLIRREATWSVVS